MISGYPVWVVLLIGVGVFCASFVDAIGGGGGIISVPVYLIAGLPAHYALGTNKLSACLGTAASTIRYVKNSKVDWGLVIPSIAITMVGAFFGTKLQLRVNEQYLKYMLLVILPVIAVIMLKQKKFPEEQGEISANLRRAIVWGAALVIGVYDGFYGPGTGTFLLLIFTNFAKMDLRQASASVKVVNFSSNISAVVTAAFAGKVLFPVGLVAAVFSILGHYFGAGMTIKNGAKVVRPVIFIVLALLAVKVAAELMGA